MLTYNDKSGVIEELIEGFKEQMSINSPEIPRDDIENYIKMHLRNIIDEIDKTADDSDKVQNASKFVINTLKLRSEGARKHIKTLLQSGKISVDKLDKWLHITDRVISTFKADMHEQINEYRKRKKIAESILPIIIKCKEQLDKLDSMDKTLNTKTQRTIDVARNVITRILKYDGDKRIMTIVQLINEENYTKKNADDMLKIIKNVIDG